jgi:Uncharacterized protein conserved in bacteria
MAKAAVFISDVHLGTVKDLKDFDSYVEFEGFLNDTLANKFSSDDLDLVLLGDILDLWQVVPESELPQQENFGGSLNAIQNGIQLELDRFGEQRKIREIVQQNKQFFQSLARFLKGKPNRKVFFIPGNHDHSLVSQEVQQELQTQLGSFGIDTHQLIIGSLFYENPSLHVYAEHGNQFDLENYYANFPGFPEGEATYQEECKGYFFVRLFWNLLKKLDPTIGTAPSRWYKVFTWLAKNRRLQLVPVAVRLFAGYKKHPQRFARLSIFERIVNFVTAVEEQGEQRDMLLMYPENLFKEEFDPDAVFSDDPTVEEFYRKLYFDPGEAGKALRDVVDELLKTKAETRDQVPSPIDASQPLESELEKVNYLEHVSIDSEDLTPGAARALIGLREDSHEKAARMLLTPGNRSGLKNMPLDPQIRYVVFGHTHRHTKKSLRGGAVYFNTGTWQNWKDENDALHKNLTYVLIHNKGAEERIDADLHHFVTY